MEIFKLPCWNLHVCILQSYVVGCFTASLNGISQKQEKQLVLEQLTTYYTITKPICYIVDAYMIMWIYIHKRERRTKTCWIFHFTDDTVVMTWRAFHTFWFLCTTYLSSASTQIGYETRRVFWGPMSLRMAVSILIHLFLFLLETSLNIYICCLRLPGRKLFKCVGKQILSLEN